MSKAIILNRGRFIIVNGQKVDLKGSISYGFHVDSIIFQYPKKEVKVNYQEQDFNVIHNQIRDGWSFYHYYSHLFKRVEPLTRSKNGLGEFEEEPHYVFLELPEKTLREEDHLKGIGIYFPHESNNLVRVKIIENISVRIFFQFTDIQEDGKKHKIFCSTVGDIRQLTLPEAVNLEYKIAKDFVGETERFCKEFVNMIKNNIEQQDRIFQRIFQKPPHRPFIRFE